MGNCNLKCCSCIERKDTYYNQISSHPSQKREFNQSQQNRECDFYDLLTFQNIFINNEKKQVKTNVHTIEDYKNKNNWNKYNEKTKETNYKEISFKYSKKETNDRYYSPNNRYDNIFDTIKYEKNKIDKYNENNENKEEDIVVYERKSPTITPRYFRTNFKTIKNNTYNKYFDKIEDAKKKLDMTENYHNKITNLFPIKYNKDKYITYFTNDDNKN